MTATEALALDPSRLHQPCDPAQFDFETTAELAGLTGLIGQVRAMEAVRFGAGIRHDGYNIFVLGPPGLGKRSLVRQFLAGKAKDEPKACDWCYVNNFDQPHKPQAMHLPPGKAEELRRLMAQLVDYLRTAIPALFESEEYGAKTKTIQEEFESRQRQAFQALGEEAAEQQIVLIRSPHGFGFAPTRDGEAIKPDEFEKLPEEEKTRIAAAIADLQARLEKILEQIPQWWKERSERIKQLNRDTTQSTVQHALDDLRARFADLPVVQSYLGTVQQDMVEHADDFRKPEESTQVSGLTLVSHEAFHRYQVNVLVSNGTPSGAPIVVEDNPTYSNLVGRVEHIAQLGALVTDFTLIKPGALHRANGGYLLLDARKVLMQPFAWEALKRALQSREIHIESLGQMYSLVSTVSLEPAPVPLDAKIVLFGERLLYYLLLQHDPEFAELFKVAADFDDEIERTAQTQGLYARLIASLIAKEQLLPFDRAAVARVIEHSARLVGDAQRLSTHMRSVIDLLQEADHWARSAGSTVVGAGQVQQAIDSQIHRHDRLRDRLQEAILRGTLLIDTQGAVTGQVNGLSVLDLGNFAFAQPTRITATTRLGSGDMIDIEREVKLSGAIHSKGVLILTSFLAARFARDQPLSLSASLVFEQSYGQIDGDSASLAELCVLLSSLAGLPIWQSLAVTGSVNQLGQVQAIGAVNEKVEGFFDICQARGLTGDQGVLIPTANIKDLMLRHDVVGAVRDGKFRVFAVDHVDQAMSLLAGMPAGVADGSGEFPEDSVNQRVAARLAELTRLRKTFAQEPGAKPAGHAELR